MTIETKYSINDLVKHKLESNPDGKKLGYMVMEVKTETCYAGTQIFYMLRQFVCLKEIINPYSQEKRQETWCVTYAFGAQDNSIGWLKLREDELIPLDKETADLININNPKKI